MAHWETDLIKELEEAGEVEARRRLDSGDFGLVGGSKWSVVAKWLEAKKYERRSSREIRTLQLSEEANALAREALSNSRDALSNSRRSNRIAMSAIILSVVTAMIAAIIALYQ